ncbi:MAG: AmmeMemoRadiSam system protein B [Bacteroidales bacterium]|nr:AmmeMemoRadiSam system protein B [Bacteroidales bacterium]
MKLKTGYVLAFTILMIMETMTMEGTNAQTTTKLKIRPMMDSVGFATHSWQMDSILARIDKEYGSKIQSIYSEKSIDESEPWKLAICPHDDYAYASYMYPAVLRPVKAKTIFLFGVAHKARLLNLEDKLVFGNYDAWKLPYGKVNVSSMRDKIIEQLPAESYVVSDSMMKIEHSLEAILPFLQKQNPETEIIPILVPYMSYKKMQNHAAILASAIEEVTQGMQWGQDFAFIISSDAVHYGEKGWGGNNFAFMGTGEDGYLKAVDHEMEIMKTLAEMTNTSVKRFMDYTLDPENYKKYKWTWCGRYSIPLGLLTALELQKKTPINKLKGTIIDYATSIDHQPLKVDHLEMGNTAPANIHHWVGYPGIGYR